MPIFTKPIFTNPLSKLFKKKSTEDKLDDSDEDDPNLNYKNRDVEIEKYFESIKPQISDDKIRYPLIINTSKIGRYDADYNYDDNSERKIIYKDKTVNKYRTFQNKNVIVCNEDGKDNIYNFAIDKIDNGDITEDEIETKIKSGIKCYIQIDNTQVNQGGKTKTKNNKTKRKSKTAKKSRRKRQTKTKR